MNCSLKFNYKKATQSLNFFAINNGGSVGKLKALKLIYFADKYHLRKYGRPIINDEYFAMERGPVASGVKDIAEMSKFLGNNEKRYAEENIKPFREYSIKSIAPIDFDVFSDSEIEALEFSLSKFGEYGDLHLSNLTHRYPEWKKHKNALEINSRIRMDYLDFFEDSADDIEKCYILNTEEKQDKIDEFSEISSIESFLR